jgi:hypothetical protein
MNSYYFLFIITGKGDCLEMYYICHFVILHNYQLLFIIIGIITFAITYIHIIFHFSLFELFLGKYAFYVCLSFCEILIEIFIKI